MFLTRSKEPPVAITEAFLKMHKHANGGMLRYDQGGKLTQSDEFRIKMIDGCGYVTESTGANNPAKNGGA